MIFTRPLVITILAFFLTCFVSLSIAQEDPFPGRKLYDKVATIETDELYNNRDKYTVVDVRSTYEFETLHVKDARHIALNDEEFVEKARALTQETGKPLVFYCNGKTCYKSYNASAKAYDGGLTNNKAYDAGIFDWATAHPDAAVLLGESPVDTTKLISSKDFKSRLLEPAEFGKRVNDGNHATLDIRNVHQRGSVSLYILDDSIPLDDTESLNVYLTKIKADGTPLLVYDMAGKQVRWFQYYLEKMGITDYHFLKGGVKNVLGR